MRRMIQLPLRMRIEPRTRWVVVGDAGETCGHAHRSMLAAARCGRRQVTLPGALVVVPTSEVRA